MDYQKIIEKYNMQPHPEGGFYVETFRSTVNVEVTKHEGEKVIRSASTAIYFLLTPGNISRLHRIQSDEVWHYYLGGSITVVELTEEGGVKTTIIGPNIELGECPQYTVKANRWFGSFINDGATFSLVGCTVSPGFVFEDFELASRSQLLQEYSAESHELIVKLTEGLP